MCLQLLHHVGDSPRNGKCATASERVTGVLGERHHIASGHMQAGSTRLQGPQHDAVARQDDATKEVAMLVYRLYRHGCTHHHDHTRARVATRQQATTCANHGHPSISPQTGRVLIAIGHTAFGVRRHHPTRRHVPNVQLLFNTTHDRGTGHHTPQHALGRG